MVDVTKTRLYLNYIIFIYIFLAICSFTKLIQCRKHHLVLQNDRRLFFPVSSFGYLIGGQLTVIVRNLTLEPDIDEKNGMPEVGFTLIRSNHRTYPFTDEDKLMRSCYLHKPKNSFSTDIVSMGISFKEEKVILKCYQNTQTLRLGVIPATYHPADSLLHHHQINRRAAAVSIEHPDNKVTNVSGSFEFNSAEDMQPPEPPSINKSVSLSPEQVNPFSELTNLQPKNGNILDTNLDNIPELKNPLANKYDIIMDRANSCSLDHIPLTISLDEKERKSVSFNFTMAIYNASEEGVYFLTFHNCRGRTGKFGMSLPEQVDLDVYVYETNFQNNYLSAGHMPLPQLYFALSVLFFLVGMIWMNFMWQQRGSALKIHYLMSMLIFAKTSSLFFRAINYHYIAMDGYPVETWAYLFYASRLIKGALFFITLILIGSGWTFIKHMLSDKDKKIVLIIVPLQLLANIAAIVFDESVEGELKHSFWKEIFVLIDLACCGAILFPIVWSVRHLQEASHTDGKAAINLKKLELFRHFYIMIVGYIYFTRIITYLLQAVLSFRYYWLTVVLSEVATLIFFVVTGYFFQPIPTNPYLLLSQDDDLELEEDILFSVGPNQSIYSKPYTRSDEGQAIPDSQRLIKRDLDDPEI